MKKISENLFVCNTRTWVQQDFSLVSQGGTIGDTEDAKMK